MNQHDPYLTNLLIWDESNLPSEAVAKDKFVIFWSSRVPQGFSGGVSIPELVEDQACSLRMRYLSWVRSIGEIVVNGRSILEHMSINSGFSAWWMSLIVEKCNFSKSIHITDAIKLMAFVDWTKHRKINSLNCLSKNVTLAECLKTWCVEKGILFKNEYVNIEYVDLLGIPQSVYKKIPHFFKGIIWLVLYVRLRWALRGVGVLQWKQSQNSINFISYLFNLEPSCIAHRHFESTYWGILSDEIYSKGISSAWLHIYIEDKILPTSKHAAELIGILNEKGNGMQSHVTLDSFLTTNLILKAVKDWIFLAWSDMHLQMKNIVPRCDSIDLWPLFKEEWKSSFRGATGIANILNFHLFNSAFSCAPKRRLGFYLLENQGWEMGMLYAWKLNQHKKIIGYIHSTVRYWDLRYFSDSYNYSVRNNNSLPMPDQVAVNGPAAKRAYLDAGYPEDQLIEVEALRYLYLGRIIQNTKNTLANDQVHSHISRENRTLRLLVLSDYTESQTHLMMKILSEIFHRIPINVSIIVKPHPGFQVEPKDYPSLTYTVVNKPLLDLLPNSDVVYTSHSTSAAVDAYCAGLPVISALDFRCLNLSPLRGCKGVTFVANSIEFLHALNLILSFPKQQFKDNAIFYLDENIFRWNKKISTSLIEKEI